MSKMLAETQNQLEQNARKILAENWSRKPRSSVRGYEKSSRSRLDFIGDDISDPIQRGNMAQFLENTQNWLNSMDESTRLLNIGSYEKYIFPLVRMVMANTIAAELVTVQPLSAPVGLIFYLTANYGTTMGSITKGSTMFDPRRGPAAHYHYTDETVENEYESTSTGVAAFVGTLQHLPLRPGTIVFSDGTQFVSDDGNGVLVGNVAANGTINYATGAFAFTFAAAPAVGTDVTATYKYNMEGNTDLPQLDFTITSASVTAEQNTLKASWSLLAQQDMKQLYGEDADRTITGLMSNEIAKEINYKIVRHLYGIASAGSVTWNATPPAGVQAILHKDTLEFAFVQAGNMIYSATQRYQPNWIVAGVEVCNVIETMTKFKANAVSTATAGFQKIGTLNGRTVFKDPDVNYTDQFMLGHKGSNFLETGYVYAPYLPLYVGGTFMLDDMMARKVMCQRSGVKPVNPLMYVTGSITGDIVPS